MYQTVIETSLKNLELQNIQEHPFYQDYNQIANQLLDRMKQKKVLKYYARKAGSYALAKAAEREILFQLHRSTEDLWIAFEEVEDGITVNLPHHLELVMHSLYEDTRLFLKEYLKEKIEYIQDRDFIKDLFIKLQVIGSFIAKENKLATIQAHQYQNSDLLFPSEIYHLALRALIPTLAKQGFQILKTYENCAEPLSLILEKDQKKYYCSLVAKIGSLNAKLPHWKRNYVVEKALEEDAIPCFIPIELGSTTPSRFHNGIAIKGDPLYVNYGGIQYLIHVDQV